MHRVPSPLRPLVAFWQKLSNDWILNLAGLLAFNLLMASVPFLLVLLAVVGIIFGLLSPALEPEVIRNIQAVFPSQTGATLTQTAVNNLSRNAGLLLGLGLLAAIFLGSRLFIVIENCFGIIYRVRSRELIQQNMMAIGMVLVFLVLVPLFLILSIVPSALLTLVHPSALHALASGAMQGVVFLGTALFAILLFGLIYRIVPNRMVEWGSLWPGSVLAAGLLLLYEKVFPWYTQTFLRPGNEGSIVGFAIVILIFYNYLAFILLLGAEFNSWLAGKRETMGDLQSIVAQVDQRSREIVGMVPAAAHPDDLNALPEQPAPTPESPPTPDSAAEAAAKKQKAREVLPQVWRERRFNRSILAGQIATVGVVAASVVTWLIRRRKRDKTP
jgi:YihY family inner membrane protein